MKKTLITSAITAALFAAPLAMAVELQSDEKKVSYIMGLDVGTRMQGLEYDLDIDAFRQGLKESAEGSELSLSNEEIQQVMQKAQQRYQERQLAQQQAEAEENAALGRAFLAENADKPGVVSTDSGLQYKILEPGQGAKPKASDTVQVHYRGTLIDGTEFDSSYSHGGPATFPLEGVIPGWTEGLQKIAEGGKAELYIPAELAYGAQGMGTVIGPNATLVFEVELLDINPETEGQPAQ